MVDELFLLLDCSTAFILNNLDWHSDLEWYKIKYLVQLLIWLLSNHKTVVQKIKMMGSLSVWLCESSLDSTSRVFSKASFNKIRNVDMISKSLSSSLILIRNKWISRKFLFWTGIEDAFSFGLPVWGEPVIDLAFIKVSVDVVTVSEIFEA